jgi:hypothetical protein
VADTGASGEAWQAQTLSKGIWGYALEQFQIHNSNIVRSGPNEGNEASRAKKEISYGADELRRGG